MTTSLVAPRDAAMQLGRMLDAATPRLEALVPRGQVERVKVIAANMFARDPSLREATPESVVRGIVQICEWGLDPSPRLGQAYLIVRGVNVRGKGWQRRAEAQMGYKGLLAKAYRCERIISVDSVVVHERDDFRLIRGTHPSVRHEYDPGKDRGQATCLYFAARLTPHDANVWRVDDMSVADVNAIRDRSDGYKALRAGKIKAHPWEWAWSEMARKTMLVRGLKMCPIDDGFRAAIESEPDDNRAESPATDRTRELKERLGVPAATVTGVEEVDAELLDEEVTE